MNKREAKHPVKRSELTGLSKRLVILASFTVLALLSLLDKGEAAHPFDPFDDMQLPALGSPSAQLAKLQAIISLGSCASPSSFAPLGSVLRYCPLSSSYCTLPRSCMLPFPSPGAPRGPVVAWPQFFVPCRTCSRRQPPGPQRRPLI